MRIDKGIIRKYRQSGVLSTKPDDKNILSRQSADKNDAPRNTLLGPVTKFIGA